MSAAVTQGSQRFCHVDNPELIAHGPFSGARLSGNNLVPGAAVIGQQFSAEVAGGERHLRAATLFAKPFRMLPQSPTNPAALQRGINREHPEIARMAGDADVNGAYNPVVFFRDEESVPIEHQPLHVLGRRPLAA